MSFLEYLSNIRAAREGYFRGDTGDRLIRIESWFLGVILFSGLQALGAKIFR